MFLWELKKKRKNTSSKNAPPYPPHWGRVAGSRVFAGSHPGSPVHLHEGGRALRCRSTPQQLYICFNGLTFFHFLSYFKLSNRQTTRYWSSTSDAVIQLLLVMFSLVKNWFNTPGSTIIRLPLFFFIFLRVLVLQSFGIFSTKRPVDLSLHFCVFRGRPIKFKSWN